MEPKQDCNGVRNLEFSYWKKVRLSHACVDGCQGEWITAAKEILESNGIDKERFSSAVFDALKRGRGNIVTSTYMAQQIVAKPFFFPHLS